MLDLRDPFSRDSKEGALVCDTRRRPPGFEEVGSKVSANMLPSAETRACVGVAISSLGRATNAKLPSKVVTESSSDSQRGKEARASWAEQLLVRGPSRRMIPLEAVGRPRARRARDDTLAVTPLRRGCCCQTELSPLVPHPNTAIRAVSRSLWRTPVLGAWGPTRTRGSTWRGDPPARPRASTSGAQGQAAVGVPLRSRLRTWRPAVERPINSSCVAR